MNLEIKAMWIDSSTQSLESYIPADPENFGIWIELRVGSSNRVGADDFRLFVCTPDWLKLEVRSNNQMLWGRHLLILSEFDLPAIKHAIVTCIKNCSGKNCSEEDYDDVARKISQFMSWEFEGYQQ